jgi:hypothetical protein
MAMRYRLPAQNRVVTNESLVHPRFYKERPIRSTGWAIVFRQVLDLSLHELHEFVFRLIHDFGGDGGGAPLLCQAFDFPARHGSDKVRDILQALFCVR